VSLPCGHFTVVHMRSSRHRTWRTLLLAAGVLASLGAVVAVGVAMSTAAPARPEAVVAVEPGDSNTALPELAPAAIQRLTQIANSNDSVVLVEPGSVSEIDLTPRFGTDVDQDQTRRATKIQANVAGVEQRIAVDQNGGSRDLLDVIDQGSRAAQGRGVRDLIVVGSPLQLASPLDLRVVGLLGATGREITTDLRTKGYVPDTRGLSVSLNLLEPAGLQEPLSPPVRAWLEQVWHGIVQAGGAAQITVSWVPYLKPTATEATPTLAMPTVSTTPGRQCRIDAAFAFVVNTAFLTDENHVRDAISRCVAELRLGPGQRLLVVGHTSLDVQVANAGRALSVQRAQRIAGLLVDAGVPASRVLVEGVGATRPVVQPAQDARNRVVIVSVIG